MRKEEINKILSEFEKDYGEIMVLKANLKAINQMIVNTGKEEKLYNMVAEIIKNYREKQHEEYKKRKASEDTGKSQENIELEGKAE